MNISGVYISSLDESIYNPNTDYVFGISQKSDSITGFKTIRGVLDTAMTSGYCTTSSYARTIDMSAITNQFLNTYNNSLFGNITITGDAVHIGSKYVFPNYDGLNGQTLYISNGSGIVGWSTPFKLNPIPINIFTGTTYTGSSSVLMCDGSSSVQIPTNEVWYCNVDVASIDSSGNCAGTFLHLVVKNQNGSMSIINGVKNDEQLLETGNSGSYRIHAHSSLSSETTGSWIQFDTVNPSYLTITVRNLSEITYTNWKAVIRTYKVNL